VHGQRCRKTTTLHGRPDIKDQYDLIQRHHGGSCKLAGVLLTHLHMGERPPLMLWQALRSMRQLFSWPVIWLSSSG
jgi:hypothetical protein